MSIIIIGISLSDIGIMDMINKKIMYKSADIYESEIVPRVFDENWPSKTDIPCWYCKSRFTSRPFPIIIKNESMYEVKGICCSYSHAKGYILYYRDPDINYRELNRYINYLDEAATILEYNYLDVFNVPHFYESPEYGWNQDLY